MLEAAVRTENDQCLEMVDGQSADRKLQDVLSLRLPFFYRCAFRLLGNAADAEDAVQEALLAAYKHINQFRGQSHVSADLEGSQFSRFRGEPESLPVVAEHTNAAAAVEDKQSRLRVFSRRMISSWALLPRRPLEA
jgi:RNA polymerase sigma-70 factor, ECF subfamily